MSEKIDICDAGITNLHQGIIGQAVSDYVNARLHLDELNDRSASIVKLIREDCKQYEYLKKSRERRGKKEETEYKIQTLEDAEKKLDFMIRMEQSRVDEVVRFFLGDHYASMCEIDGKQMLKYTEAKYKESAETMQKALEKGLSKKRGRIGGSTKHEKTNSMKL